MPPESSRALWLSHPFLLAKTGLRLWAWCKLQGESLSKFYHTIIAPVMDSGGGSGAKEEDEANQYLAFNKP